MVTKKQAAPEVTALHQKYRPTTLARCLGNADVIAKLQGIIKTGKFPSAIAFFGPPSAGKTTFARAFAFDVNGELGPDFKEVNAADERGIDDVRELIRISKFAPQTNKRIIFIDEAHQLVSNAVAAQALLKDLENPSPNTLWILGSMEPSKFMGSTVGKAILTRCIQLQLEPYSNSDLLKQAVRIAKGESMAYIQDEDRALLKQVVKNCNGEMRTLANLMQQAQMYAEAQDTVPKLLTAEQLATVLNANTITEDRLATEFMIGLYSNKYGRCHRATLDVNDQFHFMKQVGYIAKYMLDNCVLNGERHPKVWPSAQAKAVVAAMKGHEITLGTFAAVNYMVTKARAESLSFQMPATDLLTVGAYEFIRDQARAAASTKKKES